MVLVMLVVFLIDTIFKTTKIESKLEMSIKNKFRIRLTTDVFVIILRKFTMS